MAKQKLRKFREVGEFKNCFFLSYEQFKNDEFPFKGKWNKAYFKNDKPIVLELGCGKGEYSVGLAERFPDKNFVGIDLKGNRIWTGAKSAIENKMDNVAFIRTRVDYVEGCFAAGEIDEIWITFPDPQPQQSRVRGRLTNMMFLKRYKSILKDGGIINLKTDAASFYEYTLEVIAENKLNLLDSTNNLYLDPATRPEELTSIKTYYEKKFSDLGFDICYLKFKFE